MPSREVLPAIRNCSNEGQYGPCVRFGVQLEVVPELADQNGATEVPADDMTNSPSLYDDNAHSNENTMKIVGIM
jgi:hypothetical protein